MKEVTKITRLTWDKFHSYETGIDRGVFYPSNGPGEAWNGLTIVKESPTNSDEQLRYVDGVKTLRRRRYGAFSGTIEALTYPESFYENVLTQRRPDYFGFSYRVKTDEIYKIHLVYNVLVSPSSYNYQQTETEPFSWDFTTRAINIPGAKLSAHLVIDGSKAYSWAVAALEDILYGTDSKTARLPSPEEVVDLFEVNSIVLVIDNGDGTFTVTGPDSIVKMLDTTTFEINWPSAVYIDEVSYTITSL